MDNTVNLSNINGGSFPLIDRQYPLTDNMKTYLTKNVPFFNPINSNVNIVFSFKGNLFYLYKNSFVNGSENSYLFDFCNGTYTKYNGQLPSDLPPVNIYNYIGKQLIYIYNQEKVVIPLYYLAISHEDIFEIYINQLNLKKKEDDFIRTNYVDNTFFMLNSKFNIFNLSIFTYTFDKVLKLYVDLFNNVEVDIVSELKKIYLPLTPTVIKLYGLFKYKRSYLNNVKKVREDIDLNIADTNKKIICYDEYDINNIIDILAKQVKNLTDDLNRISLEVQMPQYKYMFLMSILRYRIIYPQITNAWQSNMQLNMNILQSIGESNNNEDELKLLNDVYDGLRYPTLYENMTSIYKNVSYGDCMENVCLQFLKLVFYNIKTKTYILPADITNTQLIDLFKRVHREERTNIQFRNDWTKFVTELSTEYDFLNTIDNVELNPKFKNLYIFCSKIFILNSYDENDQDKNIKILNEVLTKKYNISMNVKFTTNSDIVYMNMNDEFTTKYTIQLYHNVHANFVEINDSNTEVIHLINEYKDGINVLYTSDVIKTLNKYNGDPRIHKYIKKFILIKLMFIDDENIRMTIKKYPNNIIENVFQFEIFASKNRSKSYLLNILVQQIKLYKITHLLWPSVLHNLDAITINSVYYEIDTYKSILNTWMSTDSNNNTIWHYAVAYIKRDQFWIKMLDRDDILNKWNSKNIFNFTVWHNATIYIKTDAFWIGIADNFNTYPDMLNTWKLKNNIYDSVWHLATKNIKTDAFWMNIIENDDILMDWLTLVNKRGYTVWHIATHELKNDKFWTIIANKVEIIKNWSIQNNNKQTIWHYATAYIDVDNFWKFIVKYTDILNTWTILNNDNDTVYHHAFKYIKSHGFWSEIAKLSDKLNIITNWSDKNKNKNNITIWHYAHKYNKPDEFWITILGNTNNYNIFNSWTSTDNIKDTVWHYATKYNKSDAFWSEIVKLPTHLNIFNNWMMTNLYSETVWEFATKNIKTEDFWVKIADRHDIFNNWTIKHLYGNTIWHYATKNIDIDQFWMKIVDRQDILNNWIITNMGTETIWHYATKYIKTNDFWMKISNNQDILKLWILTDDYKQTIWNIATTHIQSGAFWSAILNNNDVLEVWKISRLALLQKLIVEGITLTGGMINSNTLYFNGLVSF